MTINAANRLAAPAREAVVRLQAAGFTAYWAGGCVRDMLMQRDPRDIDIATNAVPDEIARLFPGSVMVGKAFGVVRAPLGGCFFEIATFRKDHAYLDGRHPTGVTFSDPPTDAKRRDFTINAMFYDPVTETIHDYVGGQADLAARLVRCVGTPSRRIEEDRLRMLRAARFAATLQFTLHEDTEQAVRDCAPAISSVSAERIRDEITRILLESCAAGDAIALLDTLGLLHPVLPEITAMKGQAQPEQFHPEGDVFQHTILMLNLMRERDTVLAYAALLHDVGKPDTAIAAPDRIRFHNHASRGADMAAAILRRLRFRKREADQVVHCIRNHMRFIDVPRMKRATLRRLVGAPTFCVELELHRLDCLASHGGMQNYDFLLEFRREMAREPVLPKRWVSGRDLLPLGIPQGPAVGTWLRRAYDAQLEERFGDRDSLLAWLRKEIAGQQEQ